MVVADTIFALSSGRPPAGIAVVRVSGSRTSAVAKALTNLNLLARKAILVTVKDSDGAMLDRALALRFDAPATATGEDILELHLHGGRAIVDAVLAELARQPGLRAAEAGEFTRRALANGRIDLLEAEGLADLLAAETEGQRRQAMAFASGGVSQRIERWQLDVLEIAARVEAAIDFSDEDDVGDTVADGIRDDITVVRNDVAVWLARPPAERLADGVSVVIAGPPNAGKSTLLNAIVEREAAIVSPIAGTTRDIVEASIAIAGIPFRFADTAGLREGGDDAIEAIGIARAEAALAAADIVLWLGEDDPPERANVVRIAAQADRRDGDAWEAQRARADLTLSAVTGEGVSNLVALLVEQAGALLPVEGEVALNRRQRAALAEVAAALEHSSGEDDILLIAERLRLALAALDALTGRARTEDMLDALFGRFCIGK